MGRTPGSVATVNEEPGESVLDNAVLMQDVLGWDVATWTPAVVFWEQSFGSPTPPLRCLEVGAGPGGPSLWLALKGHDVICTNFEMAREQAEPLHIKYGVTDRIHYADVDVTKMPYENEFDVVVFKSVLGGVEPDGWESQKAAMREIHKALKPGGRLFFAENMRGTIFHRLARGIAYKLRKSSWRFLSHKEMRELLSIFSSSELYSTGELALFGLNESQRGSLAKADAAWANRLVPDSWRYVSSGVATK